MECDQRYEGLTESGVRRGEDFGEAIGNTLSICRCPRLAREAGNAENREEQKYEVRLRVGRREDEVEG